MKNITYLTVTTFDLDQINGLNILVNSIMSTANIELNLIVLSPAFVNRKYNLKQKNILVDIGNKNSDKYYCKFVLPEYCTTLDDSQIIFYIDPDHYCFNFLEVPLIEENTILVSSESCPIWKKLSYEKYFNTINKLFPTINCDDITHYNTSIIICKTSIIKQIYPYWKKVYENLHPIIPHRHLEELSFSIASILARISIKPVESTFQGNFQNKETRCSIFHYGGNYTKSKLIKDSLKEKLFPNVDEIEKKIINKIKEC